MENEIVSYLLFKVAACICCKEGSGNDSATLMCLEAEISQTPCDITIQLERINELAHKLYCKKGEGNCFLTSSGDV